MLLKSSFTFALALLSAVGTALSLPLHSSRGSPLSNVGSEVCSWRYGYVEISTDVVANTLKTAVYYSDTLETRQPGSERPLDGDYPVLPSGRPNHRVPVSHEYLDHDLCVSTMKLIIAGKPEQSHPPIVQVTSYSNWCRTCGLLTRFTEDHLANHGEHSHH